MYSLDQIERSLISSEIFPDPTKKRTRKNRSIRKSLLNANIYFLWWKELNLNSNYKVHIYFLNLDITDLICELLYHISILVVALLVSERVPIIRVSTIDIVLSFRIKFPDFPDFHGIPGLNLLSNWHSMPECL